VSRIDCDLAIVGSGFGGTLLALIARKLGYGVALLERGSHPRFAIGESSTPLADFKLAAIADQFGLDWLKPFAKYGAWKARYPEIRCGPKRGFSFFRHHPGRAFIPHASNANALLVAANPDEVRADTHWFRADFDAHLVERARQAGVAFLDQLQIDSLRHEHGWHMAGTRPDGAAQVRAGLLIDATGDGRLLARALGLESVPVSAFRTRSRALYSHFTGVTRWQDLLQEAHGQAATLEHPFPCDAAALHHIIDGGWMWVLRFDHGVTSAGFALDPALHPVREGESPEAEWQRLLESYPSLARQFRAADPVRPFVRTGRLQRRLGLAGGPDWALLPHAAGFLDAWLSPGIAQTLFAVERLGRILAEERPGKRRAERLSMYGRIVLDESAWMDEITGSCFLCFDRFEVMVAVAMAYFIAAHYCEERERSGQAPADAAFLLADDNDYRESARTLCRQALTTSTAAADRFSAGVRCQLAPYNLCGLCDPRRRNMYPFAASLA
jgi:FADH2 O2-dependent halogenase